MSDTVLTHKEKLSLRLRCLYSQSGCTFFRMSRFEEYDFYADKKDFLTSSSILTFTDADGRLMALRPDVTLSLIKHAGTGRFHYSEKVYRVPKNSRSFREISQSGLEFIGEIGVTEMIDVLNLALLSLETLADNRDCILAVADANQVLQLLDSGQKSEVLKCLAGKNIHGLRELRVPEKLIGLANLDGSVSNALPHLDPDTAKIISSLQKFRDKIRIDFSVADNLIYYNGIVFKGYIDGIPEAVISGGQYDIMNTTGAGFAVYLDYAGRD